LNALVIALPSEAYVPVYGSISPTFSGADCACTNGAPSGLAASATPAAPWMNSRRVMRRSKVLMAVSSFP